MISTPADFAGELALPLERRMRESGWTAAVTGFNGDYIGYILPTARDDRATYETMSFFGPGMGQFAADIIGRMANILASPPESFPSARDADRLHSRTGLSN